MLVLIPAYEPDTKLLGLLDQIRSRDAGQQVLIIDDGSGPGYEPVFREAAARGAEVIGHAQNRGKGYALKRGFATAAERYRNEVVVCADCDGQHTYDDIVRVGDETAKRTDAMVLGARDFSGGVPAKSRFGNTVTRWVFGFATGTPLRDTQTGLRGYPPQLLGWLRSVEGDRFDYELRLLLEASDAGVGIVEIPTATIYLDGNASSHFRPIVDSARVYAPLLRFALSSMAAALIDVVILLVMMAATSQLLLSVVTARIGSSLINYATNRSLVFRHGRSTPMRTSASRYFGLVVAILAANYALMHLLVLDLGLAVLLGKVITETVLFTVSYQAQRRWIFRRRGALATAPLAPDVASAAPSPMPVGTRR